MQHRLFAVTALVITFTLQVIAQDVSDCRWKGNSDTRIAVCSSLIEKLSQSTLSSNELSEAYIGRGDAYAQRGELDRAISEYNEAARLNRKYPAEVFRHRSEAQRKKGDSLRANVDADEMIRLADEALRGTLPNYSKAYWLSTRASAYFGKGDQARAFQDIDAAIREQPDNSSARIARGHFHMNTRQYDRAISDYTEALRLSPNFLAAYVQRGLAFKEKGNFEAAMRDLDEAVRRNPAAFVYLKRGSVLMDANRREEAQADFRKALEIEPHSAEAREALSKLEGRTIALPKWNTKSPEFLLIAMGIVGMVYILGQAVKGRIEGKSIGRQIFVGCMVAITSGLILKLLDVAGGEQLLVITIAGLLVIGVSIFS